MFIVGILSWWYTAGWRLQFSELSARLARTVDYFSIDLLLRTFFAPFRQISAGKVRGPLGVQMRAFFDNLISRFIGSMVRGTIIVIGSIWIIVATVIGVLVALLWMIVPLLPIAGIVIALSGWIPWQL
ncbi:MAG: hypothetical protein ABIR91_02080 [Candidatus Saccharimonadales bacterium]